MTDLGEAIDRELVDSLFATDDPADQANVREMVGLLETDVAQRLGVLQRGSATLATAGAVHELHQLRGAVSGFGLRATTKILAELEHGWGRLAEPARHAGLAAAAASFARDLAALRRHLGFL